MNRQETAKEEDWRETVKKAQEGDKMAMEELVRDNAGLIHMVLKRFPNYGNDRRDREDLFQIGAVGLVRAISRFDLNTDYAFSTYAVPVIIGEIRRFLRDDGMIHVGRRIKENAAKIAAARERMNRKENRDPSISELADATGLTEEEITMALDAAVRVDSINRPLPGGDETRGRTLEEQLEDEEYTDARMIDRITINSLLEKLPQRERTLIELRYMEGLTQSETAQVLGMSQVGVSRLEKRILQELRRQLL